MNKKNDNIFSVPNLPIFYMSIHHDTVQWIDQTAYFLFLVQGFSQACFIKIC